MFLAAALAAPGRPLLPQTVETGGPPSDATAVEPPLREPLVTALVGKGCCVTHSDAPEALLAAPPRLLDRAGCAAACAANPSCASFAVAGCEGEEDGACEGGHASAKSQCDELQGQHCDANCFLYSSAPKMREDGGCGWEWLEAEPPVSTGWVRVDDPFATQWGEDEWLINASHQVDLLMRTDAVQVPAAMIREHVAVKLREAAEQGGPKKKQREVKDLVTMQLRRRSLPKMQLIEAIWDLSSNEVRVHTTSKAALERFEELFNESFDVSAQRLTPKTTLVHRGWSQELADGLNHCVAVDFHLGEQTAGREEVGS